MPANLPPQYYAAKKRFELSKDIDEKVEILSEMLAIMPKHKGTDKIRAEVRSKFARLSKEAERRPAKRKRYDGYNITKQGAAQAVLIGYPNVGKSRIVATLTNADTQVAPYPFTTAKPVVGMMPFEDINMQLIDTPPIAGDFMDPLLPDLLRRPDLILLVVDIGSDVPGLVDETTGAVSFAEGPSALTYDVVDEVAARALSTGARVLGVRKADLPGDGVLAAILRFAA